MNKKGESSSLIELPFWILICASCLRIYVTCSFVKDNKECLRSRPEHQVVGWSETFWLIFLRMCLFDPDRFVSDSPCDYLRTPALWWQSSVERKLYKETAHNRAAAEIFDNRLTVHESWLNLRCCTLNSLLAPYFRPIMHSSGIGVLLQRFWLKPFSRVSWPFQTICLLALYTKPNFLESSLLKEKTNKTRFKTHQSLVCKERCMDSVDSLVFRTT